MSISVGINGFGRIGRSTFSHISESARNDIHVTKLNATGPIESNAHLLKYDSIHGRFPGEITVENDYLDIGNGPVKIFSSYDPNDFGLVRL